MMSWLENYLHSIGDMGPLAALVFVLSFAGLSMLGLPLIPFAVMGGVLFGVAGGMAWVVAGSTLGAAAGFLVGRYLARDRVAGLVSKNPKLAGIDQSIRREGWKIIALLRMCPLPFGFSNYAYGLTDVSFGHYLGATAIGILPAEVVSVCLGAAGREIADVKSSPELRALAWVGAAALVAAVFTLHRIVRKHWRGNRFE